MVRMSKYVISVKTQPQFLPEHSSAEQGVYTFAYTITIENVGDVPAQLISRHWIIEDNSGHTEQVKGLGVVGQQPLLKPGEAFEYTSGCRLRSPVGTMRGSYFFVAEDGERFDVPIDTFVLDAPPPGQPLGHAPVGQPGSRVLH
jgi:ApaG protein